MWPLSSCAYLSDAVFHPNLIFFFGFICFVLTILCQVFYLCKSYLFFAASKEQAKQN